VADIIALTCLKFASLWFGSRKKHQGFISIIQTINFTRGTCNG
jgi:hypothetical protein